MKPTSYDGPVPFVREHLPNYDKRLDKAYVDWLRDEGREDSESEVFDYETSFAYSSFDEALAEFGRNIVRRTLETCEIGLPISKSLNAYCYGIVKWVAEHKK